MHKIIKISKINHWKGSFNLGEKLVQCKSLLNPDDCLGTIVANLTETGEVSTTCSTEVNKYIDQE